MRCLPGLKQVETIKLIVGGQRLDQLQCLPEPLTPAKRFPLQQRGEAVAHRNAAHRRHDELL